MPRPPPDPRQVAQSINPWDKCDTVTENTRLSNSNGTIVTCGGGGAGDWTMRHSKVKNFGKSTQLIHGRDISGSLYVGPRQGCSGPGSVTTYSEAASPAVSLDAHG
jgi:hypothetical protein